MNTTEITTAHHEDETRPTNQVAIALIVITILEIAVVMITFLPAILINVLLIIFLSTKIYLVGAYYMGIKYEVKARYIVLFAFLFPLALASLISFLPLLG